MAETILKILNRHCKTCIFIKDGERMSLNKGRLDDIRNICEHDDTNVACHYSKSVMGEWDFDAYCYGSINDRGYGQLARIASRLGLLEEVDPNEITKKD